ncbi:hypothetical protein FRUB_05763 [Fimbriiglobus ruber]|uniref:Uncharacterized protein n=1 Tax=Fimbriiglobus ruber TaxID=1908690 RepID=A0A225DFX3_9BACT|nr:hypothetical protein FRUB_05763 [Fimbriiglobus ruber]
MEGHVRTNRFLRLGFLVTRLGKSGAEKIDHFRNPGSCCG